MYRVCHRLLVAAAITLVASTGLRAEQDEPKEPAKPSVRLMIDYGDGVEKHFTALAWKEGMTVFDLMVAAQEHPRGIKFKHRGEGDTAFLTQIDDLKNEGQGRNWVYQVSGKLADRGFAVFPLKRSDTVLWRFGEYR